MTQSSAEIKTKPILGNHAVHSQSRFGNSLKRVFDILVSGMLLFLLSPLFLYLAWRIKHDSSGPVFYRGVRTGKQGKEFRILKFRTMYETPDSYNGIQVTATDDPRITPVGRRLRATKLNELPQLWNVIKGEMSLVGPRPEIPEIVADWPEEAREEILSVRPGITSPSSVLYYDEEKRLTADQVMQIYMDDVLPSKLRLDQLYVRYRSFLGDLDILFYTQIVFVPRLQRHSPPEENLLVGPISNFVRRNFSWFTVDLLVTLIAIGITGLIWRSFGPLDVGWRTAVIFGIGFALLFSLVGSLFGVHRIYWSRSSIMDVFDLLPAVVVALLVTLIINQFVLMKDPQDRYSFIFSIWNFEALFPPVMIIVAGIIAYMGYVLVRYRERLVTGIATRWINWRGLAAPSQERALIIGGGETGHHASLLLTNGKYRNTIKVVGFVDDDLYKLDTRIHGIKVIGRCREIPDLVEKFDIGLIIFTIHNILPKMRQEILQICHQTKARTVFYPDVAAALGEIALNNKENGQNWSLPGDLEIGKLPFTSNLPCDVCVSQLSPPQIEIWLDRLETCMENGDIPGVLEQIQELRHKLKIESSKITEEISTSSKIVH